jgi:hypothetical protein
LRAAEFASMMRKRADRSEDELAMKRLACLAIALLCLTHAPAPGCDLYPRAAAVDAPDYRIRIELQDAGNEIAGDTTTLTTARRKTAKNECTGAAVRK